MPLSSLVRLLALAAIWGASFLFMRVLAPELGAALTAFLRVALAAAGLVAIAVAFRLPLQYRGLWARSLALGAINSGIPFLMFTLAALALPAGYSAILNATAPLMGVVVGAAFFGAPASKTKLAGVTVGLAGVATLTHMGPVDISWMVLLGVGACLCATMCYGLASYLTKRWISDKGGLDSRLLALGSQVGATLVLAPLLLAQPAAHWHALTSATMVTWGHLLGLSLLCTSVAYVLYFKLIADVGPFKALLVTFLVPLFGVAWGAFFLREVVGMAHVLGGGMVALSLWIVLRER